MPLRRLKLSKTARVLEKSCRRLGLIGGSGGAVRLLLRDLFRGASGRATVGTRDVDITKVGSDMSFLLILRLVISLTLGLGFSWPRLGEAEGRGEEGNAIGVEGL